MKKHEREEEAEQLQPGGTLVSQGPGKKFVRAKRTEGLIDVDQTWGEHLKSDFWNEVATMNTAGTKAHAIASEAHEKLETLFRDTLPPIFQRAEEARAPVNLLEIELAWRTFVNEQNNKYFGKAIEDAMISFSKTLAAKDANGAFVLKELEKQLSLKAAKGISAAEKLGEVLDVWMEFVDAQKADIDLVRLVIDPIKDSINELARELRAIQTMRCELSWAKLCMNIALELFAFPDGGTVAIVKECRTRASLVRALHATPAVNKFFTKYCWWPEARDQIAEKLGNAAFIHGFESIQEKFDFIAAGYAFVSTEGLQKPVMLKSFEALGTFAGIVRIKEEWKKKEEVPPSAIPSAAEVGAPPKKRVVSSEELERAIADVIAEMIKEQQQQQQPEVPVPVPSASDIDVY